MDPNYTKNNVAQKMCFLRSASQRSQRCSRCCSRLQKFGILYSYRCVSLCVSVCCVYVCVCVYLGVFNAPGTTTATTTATAKSVLSRCTARLHIICSQFVMSHQKHHNCVHGAIISPGHTHTHTHAHSDKKQKKRWEKKKNSLNTGLPLLRWMDLVRSPAAPSSPSPAYHQAVVLFHFWYTHLCPAANICRLCRSSRDWSPKNKNLPKTNSKNAKNRSQKPHLHTHTHTLAHTRTHSHTLTH